MDSVWEKIQRKHRSISNGKERMKDRWKCRNNGMRGRKKGTHIWWHSNRNVFCFFFFSKTSRKLTLAVFVFVFTDEDPKILVPWVPAWYLISSACEHGPCYNGQLVYAPSMPRLTHLDRARAKRNLKLVAVAGCRTIWPMALYPDSPDQISHNQSSRPAS